MFDEVFALWAPQDQSIGGLQFLPPDIGILYAIGGSSGLLSQFFIFPRLIAYLGPLRLYRYATVLFAILICTVPLGNLMIDPNNTWAIWLFLSINFILQAFAGNSVFVSITLLINNSAPLQSMGTVNGFAQTWSSLLKALSPTVGSYILSWSLNNNLGPPLNFYFTFLFIGFWAGVNFLLSFTLDRNSIDHRKTPGYTLS